MLNMYFQLTSNLLLPFSFLMETSFVFRLFNKAIGDNPNLWFDCKRALIKDSKMHGAFTSFKKEIFQHQRKHQ